VPVQTRPDFLRFSDYIQAVSGGVIPQALHLSLQVRFLIG
jgi:hypothetical protein